MVARREDDVTSSWQGLPRHPSWRGCDAPALVARQGPVKARDTPIVPALALDPTPRCRRLRPPSPSAAVAVWQPTARRRRLACASRRRLASVGAPALPVGEVASDHLLRIG